jgi:hypothetical protein
MPGTDPLEAMRIILDELPDLPHLVELPDRGVGADMIGRTAGLLIDLPVDTTTRGWRLADRPGRDMRRAQSLLARDLDALEEVADGYQGTLKLQLCGPWTMAASLELARSQEPVLADPGALRDLIDSLAEGVAAHVAGVAARVPGARLLLQVDEPALPTVLEGGVPSASGFNRVRAVEEADAESGLRAALSATAAPTIVHCCGMSAPVGIIRRAGADGAGIDLGVLRRGEEEVLAEAVEAGLGIFAVVSPTGQVVQKIKPKLIRRLPVAGSTLAYIRNALADVTTGAGTAASAFGGFPRGQVCVAGKTGTAEVFNSSVTSVFASYAPCNNPKYVVVVMIPDSNYGAEVAAPAVRQIYDDIYGLEGHKAALPGGNLPRGLPAISSSGAITAPAGYGGS